MGDSELPNDAPRPRLCHLIKRIDFVGYGFNLHAERNKVGQYVGKVDEGSPAALSGMKEHDRIVEVNGVNIGNENHKQVVERIKTNPNEAQLLVVDRNTDSFYKEKKIVIKGTMPSVLYLKNPTVEEEEQLKESMAKRVTIAEPEKLKNDEEEYDPHYATIATPSPPPPPEVSSPPSPVVQESAPPLEPHENDPEEFPLPPAPVIEPETPSLPPPPPNPEETPAPPTPPPQTDDVVVSSPVFSQDSPTQHSQELEIEIPPSSAGSLNPPSSAGSLNRSVTPPPPYESLGGSATVETPEASPLPSPNGNSPAVASSNLLVHKSASPHVAHGNDTTAANGSVSSSNNNNNSSNNKGADGEPVFGLSVADMRARLQAKKRVDVREAEVNRNFKEKYEIFQKL